MAVTKKSSTTRRQTTSLEGKLEGSWRKVTTCTRFRKWSLARTSQCSRYGRNQVATETRAEYRKQARVLVVALIVSLGVAAGLGFLLPLPAAMRWAISGCFVGAVMMQVKFYAIDRPSRMSRSMGNEAETWTASELRKLRKEGWSLLNGLRFKNYDVDHVLVGNSGLVIVETKWTEKAITRAMIESDAATLAKGGRTTRLLAGEKTGKSTTLALTYWGPGTKRPDLAQSLTTSNGSIVHVMHGTDLADWIRALPPGDVPLDSATAFSALAERIETDRKFQKKTNPTPKNFGDEVLLAVLGFTSGCGLVTLGFKSGTAFSGNLSLVAIVAVWLAGSAVLLRTKSVHP